MKKARIKLNSDFLEKLQKELDINENELANIIRVDPTYIWRVKNEKCGPGVDFIAGLLCAFPKLKFEEVFFLEDPLQQCQEGGAIYAR